MLRNGCPCCDEGDDRGQDLKGETRHRLDEKSDIGELRRQAMKGNRGCSYYHHNQLSSLLRSIPSLHNIRGGTVVRLEVRVSPSKVYLRRRLIEAGGQQEEIETWNVTIRRESEQEKSFGHASIRPLLITTGQAT